MEAIELVERCKKGEREAQALLYKKYSLKMLKVCNRFVADKQIAQDIMHDGFIIVFTSIGSLQQPDKLESWMRRIMTNLALRYLNQMNATSTVTLADLSEEQEPANDESLSDILSLDILLDIIEKLPDGYRKIFKLSVLDGLSHKEIAELLHIAPHSSSSQLHRAKEQLKKMISNYRAQMLLLCMLLSSAGYFIFWRKARQTQEPVVAEKPFKEEDEIDSIGTSVPRKKQYSEQLPVTIISAAPDTATPAVEEVVMVSDTINDTLLPLINKPRRGISVQPPFVKEYVRPAKYFGWKLAFKYNGDRKSEDVLPGYLATPPQGEISSSPFPPYVDNWKDYSRYLQEYGNLMDDPKEVSSLMEVARRNSGKIEEKAEHHMPFTIGISLRKDINHRWGVETGVNYTRLVSDFIIGSEAYIHERQKIHYIGIPLKGTFLLGEYKYVSVYASGGITLEVPVSATMKTNHIIDGKNNYNKRNTLHPPLQWSVSGGIGIQYQLTPSVGIFAEPNLNYYFNDGSKLKTIRKEHPVSISLPVGIRFSY